MMKMNRKALVLLASVMLAASTAGCGNTAENNGPAVEALASVPETGTEEETPGTTALPNEETAEPEEKTGTATAEPAVTEEETSVATAAPDAEPAATSEPAPASAATPAPEPAATAEPTATPAPESAGGDLVLVPDAPAVAGVVEKTETVTTQPASHSRPEGMPEVVYSEEEMIMAMLLYGSAGDGYKDNGDGTWTYYNGYEDNTSNAATTTVTTDNWYKGSEADVMAKLAELQAVYPDGTVWGFDSYYDNPGSTLDSYISNDNACGGFAKLVSDYCFGCDAPVRRVGLHYSELRPGDILLFTDHASVFAGGEPYVILNENATIDGEYVNELRFNLFEGNVAGYVNCEESYYDLVPQYGQDGYFTVLTRWPE